MPPPLAEPGPQHEETRQEGPCPPRRPGPRTLCHPGALCSQWFPGKPANTMHMGCIFRTASSLPSPTFSSILSDVCTFIPPSGGELKEGPHPGSLFPIRESLASSLPEYPTQLNALAGLGCPRPHPGLLRNHPGDPSSPRTVLLKGLRVGNAGTDGL